MTAPVPAPQSTGPGIPSAPGPGDALLCWHVALLLPTLAFQFLYLRKMAFTEGLRSVLDPQGTVVGHSIRLAQLASVNVLEVTVLVLALYCIGRVVLRLPIRALVAGSVLLAILVAGANHHSVLQVASPLTLDTLVISYHWARENPHVVATLFSGQIVVGLVVAGLWAGGLAALPGWLDRRARSTRPVRLALLGLIAVGTLGGGVARATQRSDLPLVARGYWSSIALSFFHRGVPALPGDEVANPAGIRALYERTAFPAGIPSEPEWLVTLPPERLGPRHVVVVALETAPEKYYRLIDNPALPVFSRLARQAVITDRHYSTSPYTWWSIASIVSGSYLVQRGRGVFDLGEVAVPALPSVLRAHGYLSTYLDSFKIGWARTTRLWESFGFDRFLDTADDPIRFDGRSYSITVDKERQTFDRALTAITEAEEQGRHALVVIATTIGHFPWPAPPGGESAGSAERLAGLAALFDGLIGNFLDALGVRGLDQRLLLVVTGDHGLRTRAEFESLHEPVEHGEAAFNVPFLLYAPGLLDESVRLPHVTSHVDVAPTLLALLGLADSTWQPHGRNMLDAGLRERATFMMNTNLSPVSGFVWRDCHYAFSEFSGRVTVRPRSGGTLETDRAAACGPGEALPDQSVRAMLEDLRRVSAWTVALHRP